VLAALVLSITVPPAAVGAQTAIFADDAARRGEPSVAAGTATVVAQAADLLVILLLLVPAALLALSLRGPVAGYQLAGAGLLLIQGAALVTTLSALVRRPELARRALRFVRTRTQRPRRSEAGDDWAERLGDDFAAAAASLRRGGTGWLPRTAAAAAGAHAANLAVLWVTFRGFGHAVDAGTLLAGYVTGVVAAIVAPTPQGIGLVEGALGVAFVSLGVPVGVAAPVALAYRGLTLWLPLLAGVLMLRRLGTLAPRSKAGQG
jgi:phosphatidylglycerol lysyltransferase